jgi:hypothetical protein
MYKLHRDNSDKLGKSDVRITFKLELQPAEMSALTLLFGSELGG